MLRGRCILLWYTPRALPRGSGHRPVCCARGCGHRPPATPSPQQGCRLSLPKNTSTPQTKEFTGPLIVIIKYTLCVATWLRPPAGALPHGCRHCPPATPSPQHGCRLGLPKNTSAPQTKRVYGVVVYYYGVHPMRCHMAAGTARPLHQARNGGANSACLYRWAISRYCVTPSPQHGCGPVCPKSASAPQTKRLYGVVAYYYGIPPCDATGVRALPAALTHGCRLSPPVICGRCLCGTASHRRRCSSHNHMQL